MNNLVNLFNSNKKYLIFIVIVVVAVVQRGSVLFVEFYDVDEITDILMTSEIVDGGKPYIDAVPGRPIYFLLFYTVFKLFGNGNILALHTVSIIWVLLTSFSLYLINKRLFSNQAGYYSALFYGVFISVLFEHYLAVHGELVYNLPVSIAFLFFVLAETDYKPLIFYILSGIFAGISFLTKGQTILLMFYFGFYLLIVKSLLNRNLFKNIVNGLLVLSGFLITAILVSLIFYYYKIFDYFISFYIGGNIGYAVSGFQNIEILSLLKKVFFKVTQNAVCQLPLWVFAIYYLYKSRFLKSRVTKDYMLLFFLIFSFIGIFMGGSRLYNHYFMQYIPALCLLAGYGITLITDNIQMDRKKGFLIHLSILLPVIFFSAWNYTNAYFSHTNPQKAFPQNHAIIPRSPYKEVAQWIKENSQPEDRIVQWGDIIEIYYFAQRKPGLRFLWCSFYTNIYSGLAKPDKINKIHYNPNLLRKKMKLPQNQQWTFKSWIDLQYTILLDFERDNPLYKRPLYIIDTSEARIRDFYAPFKEYPVLYGYIIKYYKLIKTINRMDIYQLR